MPEIVRLHAIAAGGDAVGRDTQNRAVFVPFGAPGDLAEVHISQEHKSFARGQITHLVRHSAERVEPPCPFYRPAAPALSCGGCQLQHLSQSSQLAAKQEIVRDALRRIGGLEEVEIAPCVPSPQPLGYRNKADLVVGNWRGQPQIGFFARESHDLIDISHCPIQLAGNNLVLAAARRVLAETPSLAFDPATGNGLIRRLVARTSTDGDSLLIAVTSRREWREAGDFARRMRAAVPGLVGVLRRGPRSAAMLVEGRDWLEEEVNGLKLRVGADAFFQINPLLTPQLVQTALEMASAQPGEKALDLFCGVGLFALALARAGARVFGVETSEAAIANARHNAIANNLEAEFRVASAHHALQTFKSRSFDLLLLDPPRSGAADIMESIAALHPGRVVYVSCDPATLARDAKTLQSKGYRLRRAVPFDLFPQTAHVETAALFEAL